MRNRTAASLLSADNSRLDGGANRWDLVVNADPTRPLKGGVNWREEKITKAIFDLCRPRKQTPIIEIRPPRSSAASRGSAGSSAAPLVFGTMHAYGT